MFTIVISEKGGAERRETFEKGEISVGRVQGNDLMLPKGNVSKHHARLLCRDGRFIVTDLKSTNGTYVNGRKTSQATIVREGDKIYIGDFVLRVETGQGASAVESGRDATAPRALAPVPEASPAAPSLVPPPLPSPPAPVSPPTQAPGAISAQGRAQELSHYPLERDPDSESAPELIGAVLPQVPGPPRVPQTVGVRRPFSVPPAPARPALASVQSRTPPTAQTPPRQGSSADGLGRREMRKQSARRVALITLVDRVADVVDLSPLDRSPEAEATLKDQIERAVREQAKAMRSEGEAPEDLDLDQLAADAVRELVGLGPIGPALEDDDVGEIHVGRPDSVVLRRKGERVLLADTSFTSEEAVARVVARLAQRAGEPLGAAERFVERLLPSGAALVAIGPPVSSAWVLTVRKRHRVEGSLEDLTRSGAMSRAMADFLLACVRARSNVLVVGSGSGAASTLLSALAAAASPTERIAVFQHEDEIVVGEGQALVLWANGRGLDAERLSVIASRIGADRLVIGSLGSPVGLAALDAIGEGSEGVLAGFGAPTLRQALARLGTRVSLARPGISAATAREAITESFDVGVEVGRDATGALRVQRIAELSGAGASASAPRDIFVANVEAGAVSFSVTGATPQLAQDFLLRGIPFDASVFARSR